MQKSAPMLASWVAMGKGLDYSGTQYIKYNLSHRNDIRITWINTFKASGTQ